MHLLYISTNWILGNKTVFILLFSILELSMVLIVEPVTVLIGKIPADFCQVIMMPVGMMMYVFFPSEWKSNTLFVANRDDTFITHLSFICCESTFSLNQIFETQLVVANSRSLYFSDREAQQTHKKTSTHLSQMHCS